jgi:hypothetical protein
MKLDFFKPKPLPHGSLGVSSIFTNTFITYSSYSGHLVNENLIYISSIFTVLSAVSSLKLLPKNNSLRTELFRESVSLQCVLCYMACRVFSNENLELSDFIIVASLCKTFAYFLLQPYMELKIASLCSFTFSLYPIQLLVLGAQWWNTILETYPDQAIGLAEYVYCPTQLAVSIIMFGVTLEQRRYISESFLKILLLILPPFLLVSTVIFQEVYIPETSTQEIIIGVPFTNPVNLFTIFDR